MTRPWFFYCTIGWTHFDTEVESATRRKASSMRTTIAWLAVTALVVMDGAMTLEAALLRSKTKSPAGPPLYKLHLDNKMCLATTTSDCEGLFGTSIAVPCRSNKADLVRYNATLNILEKPDNSECLRLEFVIDKAFLKIYWIPFDKSSCSKFPGVSLYREQWF